MDRRRAFVAQSLALAIAVDVAGCTIIDQYSSHAVAYNIEAEQAQEQQLLLNVVRASLRRPMQFTSVSSITGTQSVTAGGSITAPFGFHGNLMSDTGTVSASATGGPTYTVPVLDTQDFYRGMLQGIPAELIDLLIHGGYSSELIFNLLIEKIEMTRVAETGDTQCPPHAHWTECEFYVANDPSSDTQIELFHSLIRYLVALGMTTQPRNDPSKPQPQPSSGGGDNSGGSGVSGGSNNSSSTTKNKSDSSGSSSPLPVPYVFCFAPKDIHIKDLVIPTSYCGYYPPTPTTQSKTPADSSLAKAQIKRTAELTLYLGPEIVDDLLCVMGSYDSSRANYAETAKKFRQNFRSSDGRRVKVELKFFMRSTMSLMNFLGQIVARDLTPGIFRPEYADRPRRIWIGDTPIFSKESTANDPYEPSLPLSADNPDLATLEQRLQPSEGPCRAHFDARHYIYLHHYKRLFYDNVFVLLSGMPDPGGSYLSVEYFGRRYSVPNDPQVAGWTTQVLEITKQLIAVNTSSTQLPQTSVISVISP